MSSSSASESLLLTGEKHQLLSGYQGVSDSGAAAAVAVAAFNTQDVIHVQFDQDKGPGYAMCSGCIVCSAASSCVCLVCLPCVLFWAKKEFHAQECSVDDKRIHYKGGWVNKKEKTVPLDRVGRGQEHPEVQVDKLDIGDRDDHLAGHDHSLVEHAVERLAERDLAGVVAESVDVVVVIPGGHGWKSSDQINCS